MTNVDPVVLEVDRDAFISEFVGGEHSLSAAQRIGHDRQGRRGEYKIAARKGIDVNGGLHDDSRHSAQPDGRRLIEGYAQEIGNQRGDAGMIRARVQYETE